MGLVGKKLDQEIRRRAACGMDIYVNHDVLANPDNRLTLSTQRKDSLGIPYPHVTYDVGDYVRKAAVSSRQHLMQIANLFGATEIEMTPYFNPNNHIMGGTIGGMIRKTPSWIAGCVPMITRTCILLPAGNGSGRNG
ncbi:Uncharacterised protein [Tatumella ptyseos]|uniref:Uncharacterized protein n=1 Tax=Tatumella ptyseos TaxID=82987 RepID=A0A2X5P9H7_9GAMM|nr:Uncharacterised protein [Tatumella ptyseos]